MKHLSILLILVLSFNVFAQKKDEKSTNKTVDAQTAKALKLAQEAFDTHGGKKLKEMKNLSIIGSVDITVSAFNQQLPATFATIFSGDKYRLEINSPVANFKQIHDGVNTFTSPERGVNLPPINRLGLPLLQRLGEEGFIVTALAKKKKTGFRITAPDGYYTNFYLNKKTKKIKGYDSTYIVNDVEATTVVEIDKYENKDGILIPSKYAQRFNFGQMIVYAEFKAKEITINGDIEDDVFTL